jgi:hypothetical protein
MLVGSANFTAAGFERIDEVCIATDTPLVVMRPADEAVASSVDANDDSAAT